MGDSNLQPVMVLVEEAISDGHGREENNVIRDTVKCKFDNLSYGSKYKWAAEKCKVEIDR